MSFLAPLMLLGTLAAGIPLALHFFYRSRYRRVPWAAMEFLRLSIEQTSRRLKFQELLLLATRIALLILLAIALARPFTRATVTEGLAQGDAVDAVLIMDTSYSMAAEEGPATRLERAKTAALAVIDHLPRNSTVQIVSSADRAVLLGPKTPSNLSQAQAILQELKPTSLATDLLPGVNEAALALRRGSAPNKELYLFSDMQARGWDQEASALNGKLQALSEHATIYLVRCGTRTPRNAAIVGIAPQSAIPHVGERVGFAVLVRNSSGEPVRDLTVSLEVDEKAQDKDAQPIPLLNPGETRAVTLTAKLEQEGLRVITARLKHDELPADNVFEQVIHVRDQVRILLVDGAPNDRDPERAATYYLMHSLRPVAEPNWGKYHLQPRVVTPGQASAALLADKDLCILANVNLEPRRLDDAGVLSSEFLDRLTDFVREGHGLMIFGGANVQPEPYNRILGERHGLLVPRLRSVQMAPTDSPLHLDPRSVEPRSFLAAFREEPLDRIKMVEVDQYLEVETGDKPTLAPTVREGVPPAGNPSLTVGASGDRPLVSVALRAVEARPMVVRWKVGDGEVVLVATSADQSWTNWPLLPTFLPFMHTSLSHLLAEQTQNHNHVAGEPLRYYPGSRDALKTFTLIQPDGEKIRLGAPDTTRGRPVVTASETARAGVYRLTTSQETLAAIPFAVVPDVRESESLESLSDQQLDERLGFNPIHLTAGTDTSVFSGTERLNWEWTKWLLIALLGLALFETLLAWFCGRAW